MESIGVESSRLSLRHGLIPTVAYLALQLSIRGRPGPLRVPETSSPEVT